MPDSFRVPIGAEQVTALEYLAAQSSSGPVLVLAHGAGAGQQSRFMVLFAEALAGLGLDTVTFNFLYTEAHRRAPDPPARLEACYRAVVLEVARRRPNRQLVIGGKSMGGRIATQIAAEPSSDLSGVVGLVLLGYPLHPPGRPQQLRTKHLPRITRPMLFVQGSRDAFGSPEELTPVVRALNAPSSLMIVEGGDHSFAVPKSWPSSQAEVYGAIQRRIVDWIRSLPND